MGTEVEALPARMAAMEEGAFREFADRFGPRLHAFFSKRGLPVAAAHELAVSCVTDIALKVERYDPSRGGRFDSWVFTLAYHALADWWRAHRREAPWSEDLSELLVLETSEETNPQSLPDIAEAVRDAVSRLPERDQALLRDRDLGDMKPYGEIARQLGMQEGAVRVRHHRVLLRLKALLEPDPRVQRFLKRSPGASGERNGRNEEPPPRRAPRLAG